MPTKQCGERGDPVDVDVTIVGAGPTGLMLAGELGAAGVRTLVLERQPELRETPKAGGLSGQILTLLRYRGLIDRFEAAAGAEPVPALRLPFGGMHVDFTRMPVAPMELLPLQQPRLERVLAEHAAELGTDIRRGHEVVAVSQSDAAVISDVHAANGAYRVTARYLIGCDGARSRVRELAGIPFPGMTYPEIQRLGAVTVPESVTVLENGDIDVAGVGRIPFGFTATERGLFALGSTDPARMGLFTSESDCAGFDDDEPMTLDELRDSIRRVLGVDLPLGEPMRLTRFTFHARHVERYRERRIFLAGDAAHLFPAPGVALNAGMIDGVNLGWKIAADIDGWAPPGLLDTYHEERHLAGERTLLHTQAQVALRRGYDPAAKALRDVLAELLLDEQAQRRIGAFIGGTDIRYAPPDSGHHALTGRFVPNLPLRTADGTTSVAALMHAARPVLLDLAGRPELREIARAWEHRIAIHRAESDGRPADVLLIRPDAYVAWAAANDEAVETAAPSLLAALRTWFGNP